MSKTTNLRGKRATNEDMSFECNNKNYLKGIVSHQSIWLYNFGCFA